MNFYFAFHFTETPDPGYSISLSNVYDLSDTNAMCVYKYAWVVYE